MKAILYGGKRYIYGFLLAPLLLLCGTSMLTGCDSDADYLSNMNAEALSFSCDTIAFDTVFTSLATTTRHIKVYNRNSDAVMINTVTLQGGRSSCIRLNVDGDTSFVARNVRVEAHDSIFIFLQATIDPNSASSPFLVEDAILFDVKDCPSQRLPVTAWGRNAVYHVPTDTLHDELGRPALDRYGNPYAYSVIDCDNWDHALPHVVVGYAVVDSGCLLSLVAGDELYFANDAVLWIYNGGSLSVAGSEEQPVLFTSLRHDGWYDDLPGQWGHIWLGGISGGSSKACSIDYAKIENAYYGIIADSNDYGLPTLAVSNTEIGHMKVAAIQADDAWIVANRLLLFDCGGATFYAPFGGRYSFRNVTSANFWKLERRETPSLILANWYESRQGIVLRDLNEATFSDCIFYGNHSEGEVLLDAKEGAAFSYAFEHCLVKGGAWDEDPLFVNPDEHDYHLKPSSPASGIGYYPVPVSPEDE